jgi:L-ribulose-5-phosphate 3-epimerase
MNLRLGLIVSLQEDPSQEIGKARKLGFPTCQVSCWNTDLYNQKVAKNLREAAEHNDVEITTIWAGLPGRYVWNFIEGPVTIGLVPPKTREERLESLKEASNFAHIVGVQSITTHVGFIPENPRDPVYISLIDALKDVARFCRKNE